MRSVFRKSLKIVLAFWAINVVAALPVAVQAGATGLLLSPVAAFPINYTNIRLLFSNPSPAIEGVQPLPTSQARRELIGARYRIPETDDAYFELTDNGLQSGGPPRNFMHYFITQSHLCLRKGIFDFDIVCGSLWQIGRNSYYYCREADQLCVTIALERSNIEGASSARD